MSATTLPLPLRRQHRSPSLLMLVCSLSFVLVSGLASVLASGPLSAFFPSYQQQPVIGGTSICSGVGKNPDGSYHFSWLRVDPKTGYIMDERNCVVDLRGFNSAGTEYGDGVSGFPGLSAARFTWFNRVFNMNYIRLNLNVGWWNTDIYVPNAQMHYRAWIQQWITWAKQNGDYVLLTRTNEYTVPPCGGSTTYCPRQGEPSDINDSNLQLQFNRGHLLDQTIAFWRSITSLYKDDPAILYNDWNEMHDINARSWRTVQVTLITTIRSINPRAVIMLGSNDWNNTISPLINGEVPDLNYPNLVYDWHIYHGKSAQETSYMWRRWGTESNRQFTFAHSHGHGAVINEWGGWMGGLNEPTYNNALASYAASHHIGMAYYAAEYVVNPTWTGLNSNGLLAQAAYAKFGH